MTERQRHFTTTACIIKDELILLIYHLKFNKWLPPGGHLEANETPPEAVKREVMEETGLEIELVSDDPLKVDNSNAFSFERPYLCLIEEIPPYKDVPAHEHMDLVYLAKPCGGKELQEEIDKGHLRWFSLEQIEQLPEDQIFTETKDILRTLLQNNFMTTTK
jgi:ADP-ribose pyrophosphatase YjhB (NUDIX family)